LCLVASGLAGASAVLSATRLGAWQALTFAVVAVLAAALARAVLHGARWALWILTVGTAGQIAAVVGTGWELVAGVEATKADQLRRLGFDPTLGVVVNLVYSSLASLLFCWLAVRWRRARRPQRDGADVRYP
jgi:hypothetical protein